MQPEFTQRVNNAKWTWFSLVRVPATKGRLLTYSIWILQKHVTKNSRTMVIRSLSYVALRPLAKIRFSPFLHSWGMGATKEKAQGRTHMGNWKCSSAFSAIIPQTGWETQKFKLYFWRGAGNSLGETWYETLPHQLMWYFASRHFASKHLQCLQQSH